MPIENNLPVIFDTATQTEDGLMSYHDKIKLDGIDQTLTDKLGKSDKIASSQLDTSSDAVKIQPENLSDAVKKMMTGEASVEATVPNNGVTTEKLATNAVTIDKMDKRVLLGNVVSPRPLNFAFDTKKVSINVPQGSLFLTDAMTKRILVTGSDTQDVVVNINYPTDFDGLNYIVSAPSGTLSIINHRKADTITNSNSIMALVTLSKTYEATVVMNGNYTINGLAQGIGTESAALLSTGKIVFDSATGIIDFTDATSLYLIIGGMYNRTIESQASIRLANYAEDSIYSLYWDNTTSSLKTALSTITNTDTDINKIAMIKDGRIIPFVNTGNFYSKPYIEAPYYTETFDFINTTTLISKTPINILMENELKIQIPEETYVCLNDAELEVKNTECYYEDREGLHYILFDLDVQTLSCRHYKQDKDETKNNVVVGTMWYSNGSYPSVSGNFEFTVDGKTPYDENLKFINDKLSDFGEMIDKSPVENRIVSGNELYMINGEELPIYASSMLSYTAETLKPAISYNKNNNSLSPKVEFFEKNIHVDSSNLGDTMKLLASCDTVNDHYYLSKEVKINKVHHSHKQGQTVKVLCLGDSLVEDSAYYVKSKLDSLGVNTEMLGTMINNQVYGEGRTGWMYSTFVGASGRGYEEGKITPQTSKGSSSILLNPFIRVANADDKQNKPNDCYRSTGAFVEKNYYSDTDKSGAFYIFDFANYLEVQGIETPDVVVVAIKPELTNLLFTDESLSDVNVSELVTANMIYLNQLVTGIREALPDTVIALVPEYGACTTLDSVWKYLVKMVEETVTYVNNLKDDKVKVVSSWLHMCREFGTTGFEVLPYNGTTNSQLYQNFINSYAHRLSELGKIELANSIAAFIMNI